jgi:hypothetical protein
VPTDCEKVLDITKAVSFMFQPDSAANLCAVDQLSQPVGEVVPTDPVTLCCL